MSYNQSNSEKYYFENQRYQNRIYVYQLPGNNKQSLNSRCHKIMSNEKAAGSRTQTATRFYELMPRFIYELPEMDENNFLPSIEREIEYNGRQYLLTIVPSIMMKRSLAGKSSNIRDLFPGPNEEYLESAFRKLAIEDNVNFDDEKSILCFSLDQIVKEYAGVSKGKKLTRIQLENSLSIFLDSQYFLEEGTTEFYFRPIEEFKYVERETETYYLVRFTPFFFNRDQMFERLFEKKFQG